MKRERTFFYTLCRGIAKIIYTIIFPAKAKGLENFPQDENCIILANHISSWDPITVANFYKYGEIHFMAKDSLFRVPVVRTLIRWLHGFPVDRGHADMGAMRTAMQVLRDGHVLGIFPEGTRQEGDRVRSIESGVAVIALKTTVPVIPVVITGKYRLFGKLRLVVGPAIPLDDLRREPANTQTLEALKARIIDSVEALRPEANF